MSVTSVGVVYGIFPGGELDMAMGGGVESAVPVWAKILHTPICSCLTKGY